MKAIAVIPGKAGSVHLAELSKPSETDVPDGRGVLVKVLRVGVDGTDKEINAAEYGQAPEGYDFLVIGHECFGGWRGSDRTSRGWLLATTSSPPSVARETASMTPSASTI